MLTLFVVFSVPARFVDVTTENRNEVEVQSIQPVALIGESTSITVLWEPILNFSAVVWALQGSSAFNRCAVQQLPNDQDSSLENLLQPSTRWSLSSPISALAVNDFGTLYFVGLVTGSVLCYDSMAGMKDFHWLWRGGVYCTQERLCLA